MNIRTVDFGSPSASREFSESCRETGFAVVSHHGISKDLIERTYRDWATFFASPSKFDYLFKKETQEGYFPFKSENAKDAPIKDLKEFYHLYPQTPLPQSLTSATAELRAQLLRVGGALLDWLDQGSPAEVRSKFSQPLSQMAKDSPHTLFRIIHYPPLDGSEEVGAVRAAAHEDINLITFLPAPTEMGLQVKGLAGEWISVPGGFGDLVINVGDMLQEASGGFYRSTTHRVVNPEGEARLRPRYSMPLFVHPHADVRLSERHTAGTYLQERLKEIGLK